MLNFDNTGIGPGLQKRVANYWPDPGERERVLYDNPYALLEVEGIGFLLADRCAIKWGVIQRKAGRALEREEEMNTTIDTHHDCPTCGRCKHCGRKDAPRFVGAPQTTDPIFLPTGTPAPGDLRGRIRLSAPNRHARCR